MKRIPRLSWQATILAVLCLLLAACDQDVVIRPEFSVNIFHPGPKWPKVKKLKPAEKEAYDKFGKPDCFRVKWDSTGRLRTRMDVEREFAGKKPKELPPYTWVYIDKGFEVAFNASSYEQKPITDELRIIYKYGDPEDVKEVHGGITQWMFYGVGKLYKFSRGRIVEEKDFQAMGGYGKP